MTKNEELTKKTNNKKSIGNNKITNNVQTKENSLKSVNTTIIEEDSQTNKCVTSLSRENNEDDDEDEPLPNIEILKIKPFEKNIDNYKENIKIIKQEQHSFKNSLSFNNENSDPNVMENKSELMYLEKKNIDEKIDGYKNSLKEEETIKKKSKIKKEDLMKVIMQLNEVNLKKKKIDKFNFRIKMFL